MAGVGPMEVERSRCQNDETETETDETVHANIDTDNRFSALDGTGQDEGFQEQLRKRKRANTGSVDSDTFSSLTSDEKLGVIFNKLINIEHKQTQLETLERSLNSTRVVLSDMGSELDIHTKMLKVLNYKSLDLESRNRRKNLIFRGLFENINENCRELIYEFLEDQLQLSDAKDSIVIDRAHRVGKRKTRAFARRPIIVALRDFEDTEQILSRGYLLKGSRFGIDRDYPMEINRARGLLWNRCKELKRAGKNVTLQYPAKLVLDGKVIENAFPDWYDSLKGHRVEPHVSHVVAAANERAKQAKSTAFGIQSMSYRRGSVTDNATGNATVVSTAEINLSKTGAPKVWPIVGASNESVRSAPDRLIGNVGRYDEDDEEEDEADAAFYSQYVSRMDRSETERDSEIFTRNVTIPKEPQSDPPSTFSMIDYPVLPDKAVNPETLCKVNSNVNNNSRQTEVENNQTRQNKQSNGTPNITRSRNKIAQSQNTTSVLNEQLPPDNEDGEPPPQ